MTIFKAYKVSNRIRIRRADRQHDIDVDSPYNKNSATAVLAEFRGRSPFGDLRGGLPFRGQIRTPKVVVL